jgi:hypothetical protein
VVPTNGTKPGSLLFFIVHTNKDKFFTRIIKTFKPLIVEAQATKTLVVKPTNDEITISEELSI